MLYADSDIGEDEEIDLKVILKQNEKNSLSKSASVSVTFPPTLIAFDSKITNLS